MKKEQYLVPLAQEICLNQESFVCASANLGDIPISPASMDGFDMLGIDLEVVIFMFSFLEPFPLRRGSFFLPCKEGLKHTVPRQNHL